MRVAKRVGDPVCSQRVLEVAGIADKGPACTVRLPQVACCSSETSQAADQSGLIDVRAEFRTDRSQDSQKAAPHIAAKCRGELRRRNRGKDAVAGVRRN